MQLMLEQMGQPGWVFLSVLARLTPILVIAPPTHSAVLPRRFRTAFACLLSLLLVPVASQTATALPQDVATACSAWIGELLLGLMLGGVLLLSIASFEIAGRIVGQLSGFDMASSTGIAGDARQANSESPILVHLLGLIALVSLLTTGGHRYFLQCCMDSFAHAPVGSVAFQTSWLAEMEHLLTHTLTIGVRVAAPVALALFTINLAGGLLTRAIPSMNILSVGFSVNALAVFTLLLMCLGTCGWFYQSELTHWLEACQRVTVLDP